MGFEWFVSLMTSKKSEVLCNECRRVDNDDGCDGLAGPRPRPRADEVAEAVLTRRISKEKGELFW